MRARIAELYGIEPRAWDARGSSPPVALPPPGGSRPKRRAGGTTLEQVAELLDEIREQRASGQLIASERARLADSEMKLLALRARLERDRDLLEDRIVREHPAWQRIRKALRVVFAKLTPELRAELDALLERAEAG